MVTNSPPPPSASAPPHITTETFQKHYGRGSGYPPDHSNHGHHPLPPRHYPPSHHFAPGQPPPPPLPHAHHHGGPHSSHGYAHPSWYYPPHAAAAVDHPSDTIDHPPPHGSAPRAGKAPGGVPPSALVTPKSHDSETLPNVAAADVKHLPNKKPVSKSSNKRSNKSKKKDGGGKLASSNNDKELEMEEEPKVEPMKQDFHFYAADQYGHIKQQCQQQLEQSYTDENIKPEKGKELYILTTLLNAHLIRNWEMAPSSTHAEYLKREEADRKRFMSEEEVASRHCATLTARRRSPKQSGAGGVGRAESFGLGATVEVPLSPAACVAGGARSKTSKRPFGDVSTDETGSMVKRVKV